MGHDSSYFVDNEGAASKTFCSGAHSTGAVGQYMHTVCNRWAKGHNNMWLPMATNRLSDSMMYAYHFQLISQAGE